MTLRMAVPKTLRIGDRLIGDGQPCFIVAEAGVNHNGRVELAKRLIEVAAAAKADAVKFQKRSVRDILTREAWDQPYTSLDGLDTTYGSHRERLELSEDEVRALADYARHLGLIFLASAWDPRSADFLETLDVPAFKIASADLTNLPLLEHVARKRRPIILSTGMSELEEIAEAVSVIRGHHDELVLLQCTSQYPCELHEINLRAMDVLRGRFHALVGYSGHERGLAPSQAAVALGAVVVERHFTLDRTMPGPDHAASLEPLGLQRLVKYIRGIEVAMGSGEKRLLDSERPARRRLAKSVVACVDVAPGTIMTAEMLTVKGPGTGLAPRFIPQLCGVIAQTGLKADTLVPREALQWKRAQMIAERRGR